MKADLLTCLSLYASAITITLVYFTGLLRHVDHLCNAMYLKLARDKYKYHLHNLVELTFLYSAIMLLFIILIFMSMGLYKIVSAFSFGFVFAGVVVCYIFWQRQYDDNWRDD